jgi:signal transduction histidine kinase
LIAVSAYTQEVAGYGRPYEGIDLGLSLVKKFIDLNRASISVKSKKGKGTTFTILFKNITGIESPKII